MLCCVSVAESPGLCWGRSCVTGRFGGIVSININGSHSQPTPSFLCSLSLLPISPESFLISAAVADSGRSSIAGMWAGAAGPLTPRAPRTRTPHVPPPLHCCGESTLSCLSSASLPVSLLPPLADARAEAPSHPGVRPWGQGCSSAVPTPCPGTGGTQGPPDSSTGGCWGGPGEYLSKKQFLGEVCYNY